MFFEVLDQKESCKGYYSQGRILEKLTGELGITWGMHASLWGRDDVIMSAAMESFTVDEVCPDSFQEVWSALTNQLFAYHKAFRESKIDMSEFCIWELIPERFLIDYFSLKTEIVKELYINPNNEIPNCYDINKKIVSICDYISERELRINKKALYPFLAEKKAKSLYNLMIMGNRQFIHYEPFKTITNRLSIKTGSFPILNLKKEYRKILVPTNDYFVEFDFNAAEVRTLLSLCRQDQPSEDIYDWIGENILHEKDRSKSKISTLSWMYNLDNKNDKLASFLSREEMLDKIFDGKKVVTPFGREIPSDQFHALNYTIQSTSSDNTLDRTYEIISFLKEKKAKTFVSFTMHDSLILDMTSDELSYMKELIRVFKDTKLGVFPVNVSIGSNFGELKKQGVF
jgi:hypothetical protein